MKAEELLHIAVCQSVAILNTAAEVVKLEDGRRVRDILRAALTDYADAVMDAPAKPGEFEHMQKKHRARKVVGAADEGRK
jgi:hypothetical protein